LHPIHDYEVLGDQYLKDANFRDVFQWLAHKVYANSEEEYHLKGTRNYKLDKLCIPKERRIRLIREAHTSIIVGHFGVGKIVENL